MASLNHAVAVGDRRTDVQRHAQGSVSPVPRGPPTALPDKPEVSSHKARFQTTTIIAHARRLVKDDNKRKRLGTEAVAAVAAWVYEGPCG